MIEKRPSPLIALIDDEEDVLTYFRVALEDHGYRVVSTDDPSGALELLEEEPPDLIFLDLLMPERTGVSLYAALQSHPRLRNVPVVILSGLALRHELPQTLARAGLREPARFLEKPGDIEQFLTVVRELTGAGSGAVGS